MRYQCQQCGYRVVCGKPRNIGCPTCKTLMPAAEERPPQEPSLLRKAANFAKASVKHVAAGSPQATDEQVAERFAICQACPLYNPQSENQGVCTHPSCGCSLKAVGLLGKNKLRWADQSCPTGRWKSSLPPPA